MGLVLHQDSQYRTDYAKRQGNVHLYRLCTHSGRTTIGRLC